MPNMPEVRKFSQMRFAMVLRTLHILLCTTFFWLPACFEKEAVTPIDDDGDGYSVADGDCSDLNPAWHPAAVDTLGDGIDQNCDLVDGVDEDGDSFASVASGGDDCNDIDETIYASATDTLGDNIDQNCDEVDGVDVDKDGHASEDSGGDDCNDSNAYIKPGVMDACDAVDRDCDGTAVGPAKVLVNNNVAYETINAAISAAQEGDTLLLCAGTYQGNYAIEKDLTLKSMDGAATTILEGSGSGSVITVYEASLNLYDFTIKNGTGKNQGFTNGTTAYVGGGLSAVNAGKVVVDGCIFEDNEADDGGGIYLNNLSQVSTVKDTVVKNNTAERDGGGIYIYKSAIDFRGDITISNNTATGSGGGLLFSDDSVVDWLVKFYDGGTIEGNEAAEGGGIFVEGDDLTLNGGVQIINNVANGTDEDEISTDPNPKNGGGIEINQGDFEMNGGLISGNQSAWLGGGIKSYSANMKLTDVEISDNVLNGDTNPDGSGGGIYHLYGVVEIIGGSIKNNEASRQGGARST
jgi:predicted outer membrane repeat protein